MSAVIVLTVVALVAGVVASGYRLSRRIGTTRARRRVEEARRCADRRFDSAVDWAYREHTLTGANFGDCLVAALKREYRRISDESRRADA